MTDQEESVWDEFRFEGSCNALSFLPRKSRRRSFSGEESTFSAASSSTTTSYLIPSFPMTDDSILPVAVDHLNFAGHAPSSSDTAELQATNPFEGLARIPVSKFRQLSSFLYIRDGTEKGWATRWVALVGNTLYIFAGRTDTYPLDILPLGDFSVVKSDAYRSENKFAFRLTTGGNASRLFACDNSALRGDWITAFRCVQVSQMNLLASTWFVSQREALLVQMRNELKAIKGEKEDLDETYGKDMLEVFEKSVRDQEEVLGWVGERGRE
eukprot:TRINITY_DN17926_c4_g1_i1.p1 TRINITY_DN17926_c4_g1~~TRINITY_DN17926_c4_g1_i1.p1  ORF type:complete len:314 (-),score=63.44 TRINITY_DN17926_c4_g1_i1:54-860(-)